jgi:hypothetical protein
MKKAAFTVGLWLIGFVCYLIVFDPPWLQALPSLLKDWTEKVEAGKL